MTFSGNTYRPPDQIWSCQCTQAKNDQQCDFRAMLNGRSCCCFLFLIEYFQKATSSCWFYPVLLDRSLSQDLTKNTFHAHVQIKSEVLSSSRTAFHREVCADIWKISIYCIQGCFLAINTVGQKSSKNIYQNRASQLVAIMNDSDRRDHNLHTPWSINVFVISQMSLLHLKFPFSPNWNFKWCNIIVKNLKSTSLRVLAHLSPLDI